MRCIIRDEDNSSWLLLENALSVLEARDAGEVVTLLAMIEREAYAGRWAVGFVSYEAAPAFDKALVTKSPGDVPVAAFGIYERAHPISLDDVAGGAWSLSPLSLEIDRQEFVRAVEAIRNLIAEGITYQVNYTARFRARFSGDALAFFRDFSRNQPTPYGAFIKHEQHIVCSVSPELFFELKGDTIVSRPMKGTAARGLDLEEDRVQAEQLSQSEKDRAENAMIADMARNDIGKIARPGSVAVSRAFAIEQYPTVFQMVTEVTAKTSASLPGIFAAMFPAASITGAPKASAMKHIAALERSPRGVYTGAVGVVFPGSLRRARFSVAIRTAVIDLVRGVLEYGSGGGIVYDSKAEKEYEELCLKARVLSELRAPFKLIETMRAGTDGAIAFLDRHVRRLERSARYFGFAIDVDRIRTEACELARNSHEKPAIVRLLLSADGKVEWEIRSLGEISFREPVALRLAGAPVSSRNIFLRHKTTQREVYEKALAQAQPCDDVVLYNERGEITETSRASIFIAREGVLVTPPVECGLLPGILREVLIEEGKAIEGIISIEELKQAPEIYIGNAVRGLLRAYLL